MHARGTYAFTLIELLTVVVIIGILLAIGIPLMSNLTRTAGLQGGIRQISNTAQLARQFAITHRVPTELRITNTFNAVCVFTNGAQLDKWTYLPLGVTIDPSSTGLSTTFRPTGDLTSPSDLYIIVREGLYDTNPPPKLIATNSNLGTITVSALLGRVTIQRP